MNMDFLFCLVYTGLDEHKQHPSVAENCLEQAGKILFFLVFHIGQFLLFACSLILIILSSSGL